jgi:putative flippase GtrA
VFNKKDLLAYLFVAGSGALVQLVVSSLFQDWFALDFAQSMLPAYAIAFVLGFILTKMFAFDARNSEKTRREMLKFLAVSAFSYFVMKYAALFTHFVLENIFGTINFKIPFSDKMVHVNQLISHLTGMVFSFLSNYYFHKTFTFKSTGFYDRLKTAIK